MKQTTLYAFLRGLIEFRRNCTTHFPDGPLLESYDSGRELAHKLTLRAFENY